MLLRVEGRKVEPPRAGGVATYMLNFTLCTCDLFCLSYYFLPACLDCDVHRMLLGSTISSGTVSVPLAPITDPLIVLDYRLSSTCA